MVRTVIVFGERKVRAVAIFSNFEFRNSRYLLSKAEETEVRRLVKDCANSLPKEQAELAASLKKIEDQPQIIEADPQ